MVTALLGTELLLFLAIGVLAGAHCIGMCGPLVTIYADRMSGARTDGGTQVRQSDYTSGRESHLTLYEVRQHALFNLGRTASYTAIGAAMGFLGGVLLLGVHELTATADLVRGVTGVGIGALVILTGLYYVLGRVAPGIQVPGTQWLTKRLTSAVDRLARGPGIVGLGAVHGLLPCPILYPAYLYAFTTGSAVAGGLAMLALGLGTIPAVFAYGTVIDSVSVTHRRRLHRLLGILFVVLGYILFAHGLMALGYHVPHPELPFWDPLDAPGGHDH